MFLQKLYYLQKVWRQQWLKPAELKRLQDGKLRTMVRHAYANVPFYRRTWKAAGIGPEDIRTAEDLRKLPVVTRTDAKKNHREMVSRSLRGTKLVIKHTSGSSGEMLRIPVEEDSIDLSDALFFRSSYAAGYRPWKRTVLICPESPEIGFYERGRKVFISSSTDERDIVAFLEKFRPDTISTFPSTAMTIAKIAKDESLEKIRPERVITTGELLTPGKRRFIQSALGCEVYDRYGAEEVGQIAWECEEHEGMHASSDSVLVESLGTEGGNILLTGLSNRAMPFIRYAIGDSGRLKEDACACGRGLPLMELLEGRGDEFLRLPSGRLLGPRIVCATLDKLVLFNDEVSDFKVVQKKKDIIVVYVTEGRKFSASTPSKITSAMKKIAKEPVDVRVEIVREMPEARSGKLKFVFSEVNKTYKLLS
jgi:phenylacetate-CoA ligase